MNNQILKFENNSVEVVKTEKGYDIKIKCDNNTDIYANKECIYAAYESEEYKYVPKNMREFIKNNQVWIGHIDEQKILTIDLIFLDEEISIYIPANITKPIIVRYSITDPLEDVLTYIGDYFSQDENEELKILEDKITKIYNDMTKGLKSLGFELIPSHSMCDFIWGWQDIKFMSKDFDGKVFEKVSKIIFKYNGEIEKLLKKYEISD